MSFPEIDIVVDEQRWNETLPDLSFLAEETVLKTIEGTNPGEVSLKFTNDTTIHELNRAYRNKDKPTNVLSFPQEDERLLGDVVLAFETIEREAAEQEKSFEDHVRHLIVHGILHLMGHDHENETDAEEMEALEIRILADLGVKNPYEDGYFVP